MTNELSHDRLTGPLRNHGLSRATAHGYLHESSEGLTAHALLSQCWTVLRHVTFPPSGVGDITAGVLVLTTLEHGTR